MLSMMILILWASLPKFVQIGSRVQSEIRIDPVRRGMRVYADGCMKNDANKNWPANSTGHNILPSLDICVLMVAIALIDRYLVDNSRRKVAHFRKLHLILFPQPHLQIETETPTSAIAPDPTKMARKKKAQSEIAASNSPPQPAPAASMWYSQTKPKTTEPSTSALIICRNK